MKEKTNNKLFVFCCLLIPTSLWVVLLPSAISLGAQVIQIGFGIAGMYWLNRKLSLNQKQSKEAKP